MTEFNRCIECNERPTWYHGAHFCKTCAIAFYNAVYGVFNGSRSNTLVEDKNVTGTQYGRPRDDYKRWEDEGVRNEHVMAEEELTDIERRVEEARQYGEGVSELALVDIPRLLEEVERLRKALAFYADKSNYREMPLLDIASMYDENGIRIAEQEWAPPAVHYDYGEKARKALGGDNE